jgi:hypothetical protein
MRCIAAKILLALGVGMALAEGRIKRIGPSM